ncbi:MAG: hypothetical protein J6Y34_03845, partial [Bacteroidales bacterium]|nr:hypothetical protein [Bacteroidales bacterium]
MKKRHVIIAGLVLLLGMSGSLAAGNEGKDPQQSYKKMWKSFYHSIMNDLPESAAKTLDEIERKALAENNQSELLKSWDRHQILFHREDDRIQKFIRYLETKTGQSDTLYDAILHMKLAEQYLKYYFDYYYLIENNNLPVVGGDFSQMEMKYWSKQAFVERISFHYSEAMQPVGALKRARTEDFLQLLSPLADRKAVKPYLKYENSLYEYMLHRMANCFMQLTVGFEVEDGWDTVAWWLPTEDFVKADLGSDGHPVTRCLKNYQELLAINLQKGDEDVLIYNDIRRLDFVHSQLDDYGRAMQALADLRARHASHPLSAEIAALMAKEMIRKQDYSNIKDTTVHYNYVKAKALCEEAIAQFPKSEGAEKCKWIIKGIERQQLIIHLNEVQSPGESIPLLLEYLNVNGVRYRIVKVSESEREKLDDLYGQKKTRRIAAKKAVAKQEIRLPAEDDYCRHSTLVALPALECGQYYLSAQAGKNNKNAVLFGFQVSGLAYVADYQGDSILNVMTLNRQTGLPEAGVTVECVCHKWDYRQHEYRYVVLGTFLSDSNGRAMVDCRNFSGDVYVNLRKGDDLLLTSGNVSTGFYFYNRNNASETEVLEAEEVVKEVLEVEEEVLEVEEDRCHTTLLTDRAIYRPGQTVCFQGIVVCGQGQEQTLAEGYSDTVIFMDDNWQKIASSEVKTDAYGRFSGSFVIPTDRGNGVFCIEIKRDRCRFLVEEYKRPTFEISFEKPEAAYKLNREVTVQGDVKAYAGFGLDNVACSYRVVRKTTFPWRCGWDWYPDASSAQITTGSVQTDTQGRFSISFNLDAPRRIAPEKQPLFTFEIMVTATNAQGETHSRTFSILAGYNEITLSSDLPPVVEQGEIGKYQISAANLGGQPARSRVSRRIYHYETPTRCNYFLELRHAGLLRYPISLDRQLLSDAELDSLFPAYFFYDKAGRTLVYEDEMMLDDKAVCYAGPALAAGKYRMELRSLDDSLAVITKDFWVYESHSTRMPYPTMLWMNCDRDSILPGEELRFSIGSAAKEAEVWVQLLHGDEIRMEKRIRLNDEVQHFSYMVTELDRGGLALKTAMVRNGMTNCYKKKVAVPYDNYDLEVQLATLRDKLSPGAGETLEVTVRDNRGKPQEAALLAGMYDASLESFVSHRWLFSMKPEESKSTGFCKEGFEFSILRDIDYFDDLDALGICRFYLPSELHTDVYGAGRSSLFNRGLRKVKKMLGSRMLTLSADRAAYEGDINLEEVAAVEGLMAMEPPYMDEAGVNAGCFKFYDADDRKKMGSGQPAEPTLRENFNETAFFFPQLRTNADGSATFSFTMPDALTRWKLMLLAYTKERQTGYKEYTFTSSKPVMIMADMPRYMYDNDTIWMIANVI